MRLPAARQPEPVHTAPYIQQILHLPDRTRSRHAPTRPKEVTKLSYSCHGKSLHCPSF